MNERELHELLHGAYDVRVDGAARRRIFEAVDHPRRRWSVARTVGVVVAVAAIVAVPLTVSLALHGRGPVTGAPGSGASPTAIASATVSPTSGVSPSATSTPAPAAAYPTCLATALVAGSVEGVQAGAGTDVTEIVLKNTSAAPCSLQGFASLAEVNTGISSIATQLFTPTTPEPGASPSVVNLEPGDEASFFDYSAAFGTHGTCAQSSRVPNVTETGIVLPGSAGFVQLHLLSGLDVTLTGALPAEQVSSDTTCLAWTVHPSDPQQVSPIEPGVASKVPGSSPPPSAPATAG